MSIVARFGNDGPRVRVDDVIEAAERSAFAKTALVVKLRELDVLVLERAQLEGMIVRVRAECEQLIDHSQDAEWRLNQALHGKPIT